MPHEVMTMLSTGEVADVLDWPRDKVLRAIDAKELVPAKKLGGDRGAYLFDPLVIAEHASRRRDVLAAEVERLDTAIARLRGAA